VRRGTGALSSIVLPPASKAQVLAAMDAPVEITTTVARPR
jgi:hypothetical protein